MIDGCLAWERKDTTLEFSLSEQGRLMSGAGQFTQRSCLVWSGSTLGGVHLVLLFGGGLVLRVFLFFFSPPNIPLPLGRTGCWSYLVLFPPLALASS